MTPEKTNRLLVYSFCDKDGIVDRYVLHMLGELRQHASESLVVVSGMLTLEGRLALEALDCRVLVRELNGAAAAYQAGLAHIGWDRLAEFDELILTDDTLMGPLHPFAEMFAVMDGRDADFWGAAGAIGGVAPLMATNRSGEAPWLVVRKRLLASPAFRAYWEAAASPSLFHEEAFIRTFEGVGFHWDAYVDTRDLCQQSPAPLLYSPLELVKNRKCPFVKRQSFLLPYGELLRYHNGDSTLALFSYLREQGFYDVDLVWEHILRTGNQADIQKCLHLNYLLPSSVRQGSGLPPPDRKVALILHLFYEDLTDYCFSYALSMPQASHVYVTTDSQQKKERIEAVFSKGHWARLQVRVIENRGRSESALLVGAKDFLMDYDYVCFAHDKKSIRTVDNGTKGRQAAAKGTSPSASSSLERPFHGCFQMGSGRKAPEGGETPEGRKAPEGKPPPEGKKTPEGGEGGEAPATGLAFCDQCFENVLKSPAYVENILHAFEENPRLGLLTPPPPLFAEYYPLMVRYDWGPNFENTRALADRLGLTVDMHPQKEPIAPLGTMFWFRPKAMARLFAADWQYADFPPEPLGDVDGTLLHAIERIYPFVCQQSGYYPAFVMADTFARVEATNLAYMLRELTVASCGEYGAKPHAKLMQAMGAGAVEPGGMGDDRLNAVFWGLLREKIKRRLPKGIWRLGKRVFRRQG